MDTDNRIQGVKLTDRWTGAYVLHIRFDAPAQLQIGRLNGGAPVHIGRGQYLYIGSAMGNGDGLYLPRRLIRHLTRSYGLPPHELRGQLLTYLAQTSLHPDVLIPKSPKRLFWNIDHVLDRIESEVQDVLFFRCAQPLEFPLVERIESWDNTYAPAPGLGAHDHPGHSHFLALTGGSSRWADCSQELVALVAAI